MTNIILNHRDNVDYYQLGKELLSNNNLKEAYECFFKCYEKDSTNPDICYHLFACLAESDNYEEALCYFDGYFSKVEEKANANILLFVLGHIMYLPKEYNEIFRKLNYDDFKSSEDDKGVFPRFFRCFVSIKNFKGAHKLLSSFTILDVDLKILYDLLKKLLSKAINIENDYKNQLFSYVRDRNYEGAINLLEEKKNFHPLSGTDNYTLKLLYKLQSMMCGEIVLKKEFIETDDFFSAIDDENYSLALHLRKRKSNNENLSDTPTLLLKDIVTLIENNKLINELNQCVSNLNDSDNKYEMKTYVYTEIIRVLLHAGISIIDCKDLEIRKIVSSIVEKSNSLHAFNIDEDKMVVRYVEERRGDISNEQLVSEGNTYYANRNYDSSINVFEYLLRTVINCNANIYFMLGNCYLKKNDKHSALIYFSIAKELYSKGQQPNDLNDIIDKLKKELYNPISNMNIKIYRDIVNMVIYDGIKFEVACSNFNLNYESEMIAKLYVAKEYYKMGQNSKADYIIFSIESQQNLPDTVSNMICEIKKK